METAKHFIIPKAIVVQAYKLVAANKGVGGVDDESLDKFKMNLKKNLYKIWNRLSSGSYFPPPVKAVAIPKKSGGTRILGIPTVSDRIAQMAVRLSFEPLVEPNFLADSYGYRPKRSALDAVAVTRKRCWQYDWAIEFDIKGLFDNIDHELLLKAVQKHTECKWHILYIKRWLKAPMQMENGNIVDREKGTPQGGVISPVLANLFLHYAFDTWMKKNFPDIPWCRYADDGLVHAKTEKQAKLIMDMLAKRFRECGLEMHSEKTKIVYCAQGKRKREYPVCSFDFLGYTFRTRASRTQNGKVFAGFLPAVSKKALKDMSGKIRKKGFRNKTYLSLEEISADFNPVLRGWLNYYGKFYASALGSLWRLFNKTLIAWAMKKYKKVRSKTRAGKMLMRIAKQKPDLFVHWKMGIVGSFV